TGEYLVSGKLLTCALTLVLVVQLFLILRGLGCGRGAALALIGLLLLTRPGFLASTTIRGDLLPVVLQLAALMIFRRFDGLRGLVVCAFVCTLAVLAKQSALWAPMAIVVALCVSRRWGRAGLFAAVCAGLGVLALVVLHFLSDGRMRANFTAC